MTTVSSDPADDTSLDLYARMVRRAIGVPVALVSLVEVDRQVFPGAVGLPHAYQQARQTPLTHSFCQYVVAQASPLVVTDAREVDFLADNLAIEDLDVIAYAGWPLTDHTGRVVGSLCAIDSVPRAWAPAELDSLRDIAEACSAELTERGRRAEAERLAERSRALLALSEALSSTATMTDIAGAIGRVARDQLGAERAGIWLLADPGGLLHRGAGDRLTLVPEPGSDWASAKRFDVLVVDHTNPLGLALIERRSLFFEDRASQNTRYPAVANPDQVDEARAFMPLELMGRPLGVLVVTWASRRTFGDDDRLTMAALTSYTAQAVQRAALLQERVDVSVTLQRAMLTHLPDVAGLDFAARYLPAGQRDQVGGDWYDALVLPSGHTMVAVGDVVGHDIAAAAVMGQLRSMLRGIVCTTDETPSSSLSRLDRATASLQMGTMASLLLAHLQPRDDGSWLLRWSSAGHLPAMLVDAGGVVTSPHGGGSGDCLLGVDPDRARRDHEVVLEPGSLLFLCTDGLVERRGEVMDVGLDRLRDSLARHHRESSDLLLDLVLADLVADPAGGSAVSGGVADDDIAILAVRLE